MKLIISSSELQKEFSRLLNEYKKYYWATAWAGVSSKLFEKLNAQKDRIEKIVVGLHFYQTHPDFIKNFIGNKNVKFIKQTSGTFHPKVYLFFDNQGKWEAIVGSANFTNEAFTNNTEATILISSKDEKAKTTLTSIEKIIEASWNKGKYFDKKELVDYTIAWENHRPKIQSISGKYGSKSSKNKPIFESTITSMSWNKFIGQVNSEKRHGEFSLEHRLLVLRTVHVFFRKALHFSDLEPNERSFIAGIKIKKPHDFENIDHGWFGNMGGNGIFENRVKSDPKNISLALDEIPLNGQITKTNYNAFIKHFKKITDDNFIGAATRLLAMKRPDTFVCLDGKNISNLCKDFGIVQKGMSYNRYWDDIILRIYDSEWWLHSKPKNKREIEISNSRAAFLDSLYYEDH